MATNTTSIRYAETIVTIHGETVMNGLFIVTDENLESALTSFAKKHSLDSIIEIEVKPR